MILYNNIIFWNYNGIPKLQLLATLIYHLSNIIDKQIDLQLNCHFPSISMKLMKLEETIK